MNQPSPAPAGRGSAPWLAITRTRYSGLALGVAAAVSQAKLPASWAKVAAPEIGVQVAPLSALASSRTVSPACHAVPTALQVIDLTPDHISPPTGLVKTSEYAGDLEAWGVLPYAPKFTSPPCGTGSPATVPVPRSTAGLVTVSITQVSVAGW